MQDQWATGGERTLTALEAFDAMRCFLDAYWERGGKQSADLAILLGSLNRNRAGREPPLDIAQWHDWLTAIDAQPRT
ncbi:MAG: hypothetical protein JNJ63_06105 [Hyphomonadaceae bacterium]|nr:hypothetical protein [Hyphomonadaceae bacterium]